MLMFIRAVLFGLIALVAVRAEAQIPAVNSTATPVPLAQGGTAQNAASSQALTFALGAPYVLCRNAAAASHTGDTNETTIATCTVPANSLGANGRLRVYSVWGYTNSANAKNLRVRFSTISGTAYAEVAPTTSTAIVLAFDIANRGATNSQVGKPTASGSASGTAAITSAVATTASTTLVFTAQLASAGETITLESSIVEVLP